MWITNKILSETFYKNGLKLIEETIKIEYYNKDDFNEHLVEMINDGYEYRILEEKDDYIFISYNKSKTQTNAHQLSVHG